MNYYIIYSGAVRTARVDLSVVLFGCGKAEHVMGFPSNQEVAKTYAELLIGSSGMPDPIGALIVTSIFPSSDGVPGYFQQVYEEIREIVQTAIIDEKLTDIQSQLKTTVNFLLTQYANEKADPKKSPSELFSDLNKHADALSFYVIGELTGEGPYVQPGFGIFLTAGSLYLSVLQELAFEDPDHQGDPWSSSYRETISQEAKIFADSASATWAAVQQARRAMITSNSKRHDHPASRGGGPTWEYWASDALTGSEGKHYDTYNYSQADAQARADADCKAMREVAMSALIESLGDPAGIIAAWQALEIGPLPLPPLAKIDSLRASVQYFDTCSLYTINWSSSGSTGVTLGGGILPTAGRLTIAHNFDPFDDFAPPVSIGVFDQHGRLAGLPLEYEEAEVLSPEECEKIVWKDGFLEMPGSTIVYDWTTSGFTTI